LFGWLETIPPLFKNIISLSHRAYVDHMRVVICAITGSVIFNSESSRNRLLAALHPDPLAKLTALPRFGQGRRNGEKRKDMKGEGREVKRTRCHMDTFSHFQPCLV